MNITGASGSLKLSGYGAGTLVTDSSGNVTSNAPAVISSSVSSGSAVTLTSGTAANITYILLTSAGLYQVCGNIGFKPAATTTMSTLVGGLTTTNGTVLDPSVGGTFSYNGTLATGSAQWFSTGCVYYNISSATTVYLVAYTYFGVSTLGAFGSISAVLIH
jgi:hypothetical protein